MSKIRRVGHAPDRNRSSEKKSAVKPNRGPWFADVPPTGSATCVRSTPNHGAGEGSLRPWGFDRQGGARKRGVQGGETVAGEGGALVVFDSGLGRGGRYNGSVLQQQQNQEAYRSAARRRGAEKPRLGVSGRNPASHRGFARCKSQTALGLPAVEPKTRVRSFCSGEQFDPDLSLYYLRARYYNQVTGRFLNVDPLAGQGQRRYEYAGADPVDGSDPSGNFVLASYWPQMAALQVHIPSPKCSQGNGTSMGNSLPPCTPPPPPCKCGLKTPPEYDKGPVIPGGTEFSWRATFLNDSTHKPTCCEVRQMVQWDRGPAPPQFRPPEDQPNTWYEDRDLTDLINSPFDRYGRRGIISSGIEDNNYYDGDDYFGYDQPDRFPHGTTLKFKLIVVDVCNGTKTIYTSKILSDKF